MNTETTTLPIPRDDYAVLQDALRAIRAKRTAAVSRIEAARDAITADNYRREKLNAFDAEEKAFKEMADQIVDRVATETHVKELLVELAACRNEVKAAIAARQDVIRALKAENDPPAPVHSYALQIEVTDADFAKILKAVEKVTAKWRYFAPQTDKAAKALDRLFDENK